MKCDNCDALLGVTVQRITRLRCGHHLCDYCLKYGCAICVGSAYWSEKLNERTKHV